VHSETGDGFRVAAALAPPPSWRTATVVAISFASFARFDDLRHLKLGQISFWEDGDMLIRYGKTKTKAARNKDYTDRIAPTNGIHCSCSLVRKYLTTLPRDNAQSASCEAGVPKEVSVWKAMSGSKMYENYVRNAPARIA